MKRNKNVDKYVCKQMKHGYLDIGRLSNELCVNSVRCQRRIGIIDRRVKPSKMHTFVLKNSSSFLDPEEVVHISLNYSTAVLFFVFCFLFVFEFMFDVAWCLSNG